MPDVLRESVDLNSVAIRSKPMEDKDDLQPLCYRCSMPNPLLSTIGNVCMHCRQPFVFSFSSFEVLPLVEFFLDTDISDEEAVRLIG